ncbi:MAG: holo-ACP synthase [Anaerolineales bacterium]|nr:holo-ACP synthase [Anaerolineales bacterium]
MIAVGVDLVEVARVAQTIERHGAHFLGRVFTEQEQAFCAGNATRLAGRFAIKEAVAKALGTGIGDVRWREIEVVCDARGKPHLILHAAAAELAQVRGWQQWDISLAHTDTHAIGFVTATG